MELSQRAHDGDGIEGVCNPYHCDARVRTRIYHEISEDVLMKPLLVAAISFGAPEPSFRMSSLKSSTAFPNHMRMIRNDVMPTLESAKNQKTRMRSNEPIRNPRSPIHAVARCTPGLSKPLPNLPILPRNEVMVNMMKKMAVKARDTATVKRDGLRGTS